MAPRTSQGGYYITAAALWPMVMGLRVLNVDVDRVLEQVGLAQDAIRDPETRIGPEQALKLISAAIEATGDENLGLRLSQLYEPGAFGVLDFLGQSAKNLREAIEVLLRYERIHQNGMRTSLEINDGVACIKQVMLHPYPMPRAVSENSIGNLVVIASKLTGLDFKPDETWFAHDAPADTSMHESLFRSPIRWNAPHDALFFAASCLDAPLLKTNPALASVLHGHAKTLLARLSVAGSVADRVRERIVAGLPRAEVSLDRVARELEMSSRTLQRRLHEEGTSHEALLDELRHRLSLEYLEKPHLGSEDVALLLGFSDSRAFRRAFKRWTGLSPGSFRAQLRANR